MIEYTAAWCDQREPQLWSTLSELMSGKRTHTGTAEAQVEEIASVKRDLAEVELYRRILSAAA
jgi:hypothetical protein